MKPCGPQSICLPVLEKKLKEWFLKEQPCCKSTPTIIWIVLFIQVLGQPKFENNSCSNLCQNSRRKAHTAILVLDLILSLILGPILGPMLGPILGLILCTSSGTRHLCFSCRKYQPVRRKKRKKISDMEEEEDKSKLFLEK